MLEKITYKDSTKYLTVEEVLNLFVIGISVFVNDNRHITFTLEPLF